MVPGLGQLTAWRAAGEPPGPASLLRQVCQNAGVIVPEPMELRTQPVSGPPSFCPLAAPF